MTWLFLALMAPALWSLSNIVDKYAINNITTHYIPFTFLLSIGNILFATLIYFYFTPNDIDPFLALINIGSGLAIFMQYFAYSYSLEDMEVSTVIPIHQSEPVFVLAASVLIFHSVPTVLQIYGFVLIAGGILALCISRKTITGLGQTKHVVVLLVSAFFGAASTLISDEILRVKSLQIVLIFNFAGYALGGFLLLLVPKWRELIFRDVRKLNSRQLGVFGLTNLFDVAGYIFFTAALAVGGGAALVSVIVSIHPVFVLLLGLVVTKYFPRIVTEEIAPGSLARKFLCIATIVAGVALISIPEN